MKAGLIGSDRELKITSWCFLALCIFHFLLFLFIAIGFVYSSRSDKLHVNGTRPTLNKTNKCLYLHYS